MTVIERAHRLDPDGLAAIRQPRTDLLQEEASGDDRWIQDVGPFRSYERTLTVGDLDAAGLTEVHERTDFALAIPVWAPLFKPMVKRALADLNRTPRPRWWWPGSEVVTARSATLISVVAVVSVVAGYLGVLIGQTITFAADEFGASDGVQGRTLAGVRVGIVVSLVLIRRADRVGRRPLIIGFATASILMTALGATAQGMWSLGITQAVARGFATGLLTLTVLAVTEEVPAAVRSLSIGLATLATGLGAGMVVWILPVADLSPGSWRIAYLVPLAFLPVLFWAWRTMPETRRFDAATKAHTDDRIPVDQRRFWLLGVTSFASTLFLSPASQLLNEYLNNELDFSASRISVFRILVNLPVAIFVLGAGYLADRSGRRPVATMGVAIGATASASVFFLDGAALWISAMAGSWMLAGAYTAVRGYQTELFPTRARARVGGWLDLLAVSGSATGLLLVGEIADRTGRLGPGIAMMLAGPALVVVLLIVAFPETAKAELEDFNPSDPAL